VVTSRTTLDFLRETRSAASISGDLRREFEQAFHAQYGTRPTRDPMLSVLFQAVAVQLARIYDEAENIFPERVIDDLVAALGLPAMTPTPAQTILAFSDIETREPLPTDAAIIGYSRTGEQVHFAPDVAVDLVPASLRFAAVVEAGRLQTIPGASLDAEGTPLPVMSMACRSAPAAALYLAIEPNDGHVSRLAIHMDSLPLGGDLGRAIARSPWHLLSPESLVVEENTMFPTVGRGGVRMLRWIADSTDATSDYNGGSALRTAIAEGPYGHQTFVFPEVPSSRRHTCAAPASIRDLVPRIVPEEFRDTYERPMAWIVIALPATASGVASSLQGITLNAITASNIELMSEHVMFERGGAVVAIRPEGASNRHLLGVQSVLGEEGAGYVVESDLEARAGAGRYRIDRDRIFLQPAKSESGRNDRKADLRLLFTDGDRGNGVEVGRVSRVASALANVTARVTNLAPSRGGTTPPQYKEGRLRLAEVLRTRERAVTAEDYTLLAQAFEPRIKQVRVDHVVSIRDRQLQPIHIVRPTVVRRDFGDPDAELLRLKASLELHLQQRGLVGQLIRVELNEIA
jgi:hypothetical protein